MINDVRWRLLGVKKYGFAALGKLGIRRSRLILIVLAMWAGSGLQAASPPQSSGAGSVWSGVYTEAQAKRGQAIYAQDCARCHGATLSEGEEAPALAGESFLANWYGLTLGDLFERMRLTMPQEKPGTLGLQQYADILAYVLSFNKFPAGKSEIGTQTEMLRQIRIEADRQQAGPAAQSSAGNEQKTASEREVKPLRDRAAGKQPPSPACAGCAPSSASAGDSGWLSWGGDLANTHYRPFDQIDASNFSQLEVAWRFKTDNLGARPEYKLEGTPLVAQGILYATAGTRRSVVALDAATGELLWVHSEKEGARASYAPRQLSGRGLTYWTDGREERILYITIGYQLICLDAKTGNRIPSFGVDGIVDLKQNDDQPIDLVTGEIAYQGAPIVARDVVLVGAAFLNESVPKSKRVIKGYVRGFDVRTGKRLWIFHTVPLKGEFGYDTWLKGSAEYTGNTGVWTQMAADEKLGLAYLPVELATGDAYGGERPGDNLFSETLVAVDLKTGQRKWHYQLVHHGMWDMDISAPPILGDIRVDGRTIQALAQGSKQGFVYVFDRATGQPVWPIVEKPVEKGNVPTEWYSPTQPFPTKPPALGRQGSSIDDLIDFTPALREDAMTLALKYHMGPVFTPPVVSNPQGPIASLVVGPGGGAINWGGGAFDPETHMLYFHVCDLCIAGSSVIPTPDPNISDEAYIAGRAGQVPMHQGAGEGPGEVHIGASGTPIRQSGPPAGEGEGPSLTVHGLPLFKPPYGTITAVNLDTGEIVWQVAHGDTPDAVRNNPALKGLNIPRTGQTANPTMGTLATKTLVIAGDPSFTTTAAHPRGALLHAYDKATGNEVGSVYMPAPQTGSPMTYMLGGRQYIVVAIGGGAYSGEYVAYRLPKGVD